MYTAVACRCLTSKTVFLDGKAKIGMVDYGGAVTSSRYRSLIGRDPLCYWSPEIVKAMLIEPPLVHIDPRLFNKFADIYAFGTLIYEIFTSKYPFHEHSIETVIFLIGECTDYSRHICYGAQARAHEKRWPRCKRLHRRGHLLMIAGRQTRTIGRSPPIYSHYSIILCI